MPSIHPLIDKGLIKGDPNFPGGRLLCRCSSNQVIVGLKSNVAHNHACGCSKCWKPEGALFSVVGVVPRENLTVEKNESKLKIVDPTAVILRHACRECGVHMFGRIETAHAFHGLDFVHSELSDQSGWQEPQFAGFVSSIIEQGFDPKGMDEVRSKFKSAGLETYDALSPPLMDLLATFAAQKAGVKFSNL
ncbi:glutathione-dependent formaldehyde-activating enzyme [Penicillium atrosanguineum]|uniref:Putative glutathione-dependent formaldehyde-activating enzyme n=1 Tax=Penicillium atrosanguineum TaxID=1132637 RepID=A0A9W9QA15_9EURO|nr:translocation protein Sec62-domain-containing protein [Penicillium atrosanguineum]KAJ5133115.1 glutathione-dependent formaldehyde-activating enzyme [Penicillium atrosanguineum]KAJ5150278.1 glutathione-dependent formaldehyde-activating enzyme [Penicillium atrosanguineum]KAJ5305594.1 translocation protein Sec62-domain-containing protein [Penicillium atrosanguineum]KAJ5325056.1 glutathione-dependent formaldehyde-activating enzyme [Penicillium atrosanguineum]